LILAFFKARFTTEPQTLSEVEGQCLCGKKSILKRSAHLIKINPVKKQINFTGKGI